MIALRTAALVLLLALTPSPSPAGTPPDAAKFLAYWKQGGMELWFGKVPALDRALRDRFLPLHEAAARGELNSWTSDPHSALALVLLLDQFPRNAFRGTPRMYATDEMARVAARVALENGFAQALESVMRTFLILPFGHSENLADQDYAVELARRTSKSDLTNAQRHRGIIRRFGRFPHRNSILRRTSTEAERRYLEDGGYAG